MEKTINPLRKGNRCYYCNVILKENERHFHPATVTDIETGEVIPYKRKFNKLGQVIDRFPEFNLFYKGWY